MSLAREINDYLDGNAMLKGDLPMAYSLLSRASEQLEEGVQTQSSKVPKQTECNYNCAYKVGMCNGEKPPCALAASVKGQISFDEWVEQLPPL